MNTEWILPIVDRTELDISSKTPKAYLNAQDFNRIESNIAFIHEELNKLPYKIPTQTHKTWNNTGIPTTADITRLCENISAIVEHYYTPPQFERLEGIANKQAIDYKDANDLEGYMLWLYNELKVLGRNYNTHQKLKNKPFTYAQLTAFTHEQLKKDWNI